MIVLDTNVVSEALKLAPHPGVINWLDVQAAETLYLSSASVAELLFGVDVLPAGKRKTRLSASVDDILLQFDNRILAFDADAARYYAKLASAAKRHGQGFPVPDAYIAATAAVYGYKVATRDITPFEAAGLNVINPWNALAQ